MRKLTILGLGLTAALALTGARAHAQSMTATYLTINENDPDMSNVPGGTFNDWVQSGLGQNGLPLFNTGAGFAHTTTIRVGADDDDEDELDD